MALNRQTIEEALADFQSRVRGGELRERLETHAQTLRRRFSALFRMNVNELTVSGPCASDLVDLVDQYKVD